MNLVYFCEKSLDRWEMDSMIARHTVSGLSDPFLEKNLRNGDYPAVLRSLWCEQDHQRRLKWLKGKLSELHLHPVLMFELAVAEFAALPAAKTVYSVSLPLIKIAALFIRQHFQRENNSSDIAQCMSDIYKERLRRQIGVHLGSSLEKINKEGS